MSGGGNARRRRRRRQTSAIRRTPEQLRQREGRRQLTAPQSLAIAALGVICVALIALIWINLGRAVREQYDDTRGRAEATLSAQAATLAMLAQHELLMIDQSLAVLQTAWDDSPSGISLVQWSKSMPVLAEVSKDLFVANDQHVIVQDILPAAVGQGIGSAYATFGTGSLEPIQLDGKSRDHALVVGELGQGGIVRQYMMYLMRPLKRPAGWVIGAAFQSKALTDVFASARLGGQGIAALIDSHRGGVQAVAGVAALHPRLTISNTPLYAAMLAHQDGGIWIGRTPIDGVSRIVAFRRVAARDLFVLVGMSTADALSSADSWSEAARTLAAAATLLVLAVGIAVLWEIWNWRRTQRRQRELSQARSMLASIQSELTTLRLRSAADTAHLQSALRGVTDGVAVFDGELHLSMWNTRLPAVCGLPEDALQEGMTLTELIRRLIEARQFGEVADIQADIDRRVALLLPDSGVAEFADTAPDGTPRVFWAEKNRDGGWVLVVRGTASVAASPPSPALAAPEGPVDADADQASADPVEW